MYIYEIPTGQVLTYSSQMSTSTQLSARKLIHMGLVSIADIEQEMQVILMGCRRRHKHLIIVLQRGELVRSAFSFIDMELFVLGLDFYLKRPVPLEAHGSIPQYKGRTGSIPSSTDLTNNA